MAFFCLNLLLFHKSYRCGLIWECRVVISQMGLCMHFLSIQILSHDMGDYILKVWFCTLKALYYLHDTGTVAYFINRIHIPKSFTHVPSYYMTFFVWVCTVTRELNFQCRHRESFSQHSLVKKQNYSPDLWPCRLLVTKCIWIFSLL